MVPSQPNTQLNPTSLVPDDDAWFNYRRVRKGAPTHHSSFSQTSPAGMQHSPHARMPHSPMPHSPTMAPVPSFSSPSGGARHYSDVARRAQTSGLGTSHVTGQLEPHVVSETTSWVPEMLDGAGESSQQAARREAGGYDRQHFFAQPLIAKEGFEPFHSAGPLNASAVGPWGTHFEPGSGVDLQASALQPSDHGGRPLSRRGRRGIPEPTHEQPQDLTSGRVRQTAAHRDTFDGHAAAAIMQGHA